MENEIMNELGTLHELNGRFALRFEQFFFIILKRFFLSLRILVTFLSGILSQLGRWISHLVATIDFDDGEGTTYYATITELEPPYLFGFLEVDDGISISLQGKDKGCLMTFTHTFDDDSWAVSTAAGWHRCLDVLSQIVNGKEVKWEENAAELRKSYSESLNMKQ